MSINTETVKWNIEIYGYNNTDGTFTDVNSSSMHGNINTSAKQLFEETIQWDESIANRFFLMSIQTIAEIASDGTKPFEDHMEFYTIRTNSRGIEEISIIGPNMVDKDILIDAIIGCEPTQEFIDSCKDRIVDKLVTESEWAHDAKERLSKVNPIRLKEIYTKLKS